MDRAELLSTALEAVNARPKAYGPPERNFERIARHWNVYLTGKYGAGSAPLLDAVDVAAMMALMKIARLEETPDHIDSWVDLAGYAACGAECATVIEHDPDERLERDLADQEPSPPIPRFKVGDEVIFTDLPSYKFTVHRIASDGSYSIRDRHGSVFHDYNDDELTPA